MKARIIVRLKSTVHDPQGEAILQSLHHMNYSNFNSVRQGKEFDLELGNIQEPKQNLCSTRLREKFLRTRLLNSTL